jgi:hypothetical protein
MFVGVSFHPSYSAKTEFVWLATAAARERREMDERRDHSAATHGRHPAPAAAYRNNVSPCSSVLLVLRGGGILSEC